MAKGYQFEGFGDASGIGERPAVVVVDFIKGFTDPACPLGSKLDAQVGATVGLLELVRARGLPVYFTTVVYGEADKRAGYFLKKVPALGVLTPGSEWVKLDDRLGRQGREPVFIKRFASAFFGTDLNAFLAFERADTVIVTGCTTSGCVRATAVDALQYGYRVIVPEECVGDRSAEAHAANLRDIQTKYGDVVPVETVMAALKDYPCAVREG